MPGWPWGCCGDSWAPRPVSPAHCLAARRCSRHSALLLTAWGVPASVTLGRGVTGLEHRPHVREGETSCVWLCSQLSVAHCRTLERGGGPSRRPPTGSDAVTGARGEKALGHLGGSATGSQATHRASPATAWGRGMGRNHARRHPQGHGGRGQEHSAGPQAAGPRPLARSGPSDKETSPRATRPTVSARPSGARPPRAAPGARAGAAAGGGDRGARGGHAAQLLTWR